MNDIQNIIGSKLYQVPALYASILGYETDVEIEVVQERDNPVLMRSKEGGGYFLGNLDSFKNPLTNELHIFIKTALGVFNMGDSHLIVGHIKKITVKKKSKKISNAEFSEFLRSVNAEFGKKEVSE